MTNTDKNDFNATIGNTMLCEGLTLQQWIENEQKPRKISLWGSKVQDDFVPELCSIIEGDGLQLVYFGTINQRPRWWMMRIDSKHNIESDEFSDSIEQIIIDSLEEDFGRGEYMSESEFETLKAENDEDVTDYENQEDWLDENYRYPRVQSDGFYWGLIVNIVTGERG